MQEIASGGWQSKKVSRVVGPGRKVAERRLRHIDPSRDGDKEKATNRAVFSSVCLYGLLIRHVDIQSQIFSPGLSI